MKLSDVRNEDAVVMLGKLVEPITMITTNPTVSEFKKNLANVDEMSEDEKKRTSARLTGLILQSSPKEIKDVIAILNGKDTNDYECSFAEILAGVTELINDDELRSLFF